MGSIRESTAPAGQRDVWSMKVAHSDTALACFPQASRSTGTDFARYARR